MLTFPNGKRYIGVSVGKGRGSGIGERWSSYRKLKCESQVLLYHALRKYGPENVRFEVISTETDPALLLREEIRFIEEYKTRDPEHGYNILAGGDCSRLGMMNSEEHRRKIGLAQKGKKLSPEHRKKLKESYAERRLLGLIHINPMRRPLTQEQRELVTGKQQAAAAKKRELGIKRKSPPPVSAETRAKLSTHHKGRPKDPVIIKKMMDGQKRWRELQS